MLRQFSSWFFHSTTLEATQLLGTFRAAGLFLKSSPDLFLHMILPLAKPWKSFQLKDKAVARLTPRTNFNQPRMFSPKSMSGLREEARGPEENQRRTRGEHRHKQNKQMPLASWGLKPGTYLLCWASQVQPTNLTTEGGCSQSLNTGVIPD